MDKFNNPFKALIPLLIKIAVEELNKIKDILPVGSYKSNEVVRVLRKNFKNYVKVSRKCLKNKDCINFYIGEYLNEDFVTVKSNDLSLSFPRLAVFYILWKVEIYAGIKSKDRHRLKVEPIGELVSNGVIELPEKHFMSKLGRIIKWQANDRRIMNNNSNEYRIELDLYEGKIHIGTPDMEQCLNPDSFNLKVAPDCISQLPFKSFGNLYGKCNIKVYKFVSESRVQHYLVFETAVGDIISNHEYLKAPASGSDFLVNYFERKVEVLKNIRNN